MATMFQSASCAMMVGSGIVSTRTSPFPCQHSARMVISISRLNSVSTGEGRRRSVGLGSRGAESGSAQSGTALVEAPPRSFEERRISGAKRASGSAVSADVLINGGELNPPLIAQDAD